MPTIRPILSAVGLQTLRHWDENIATLRPDSDPVLRLNSSAWRNHIHWRRVARDNGGCKAGNKGCRRVFYWKVSRIRYMFANKVTKARGGMSEKLQPSATLRKTDGAGRTLIELHQQVDSAARRAFVTVQPRTAAGAAGKPASKPERTGSKY